MQFHGEGHGSSGRAFVKRLPFRDALCMYGGGVN